MYEPRVTLTLRLRGLIKQIIQHITAVHHHHNNAQQGDWAQAFLLNHNTLALQLANPQLMLDQPIKKVNNSCQSQIFEHILTTRRGYFRRPDFPASDVP